MSITAPLAFVVNHGLFTQSHTRAQEAPPHTHTHTVSFDLSQPFFLYLPPTYQYGRLYGYLYGSGQTGRPDLESVALNHGCGGAVAAALAIQTKSM